MGNNLERMRIRKLSGAGSSALRLSGIMLLLCSLWAALPARAEPGKQTWKPLPFAIVRYNDDAPKSWSVYRGDRKGIYLVRLWKRYLLVDTDSQNVFEIDPGKVKVEGENAELATTDIPAEPIAIADWKTRNAGPVLRHRFRFGQSGNYMELQIPVLLSGKPAY